MSSVSNLFTEPEAVRSLFKRKIIVLEGPDGVGKTTVCHELVKLLKEKGEEAVYMRCPGSTRLGEMLRGPLKDPSWTMSVFTMTMLFVAVDNDAHEEAERLADEGKFVVMDRCAISNVVYRRSIGEFGIARDLMYLLGDGMLAPKGSKIVFLDADDEVRAERLKDAGRFSADRFDGLGGVVGEEYRKMLKEVRERGYDCSVIQTDLALPEMIAKLCL